MSDSVEYDPSKVLPCDQCPAETDDCAKKKLRGTQTCIDMIEHYNTTYLPVIKGMNPETEHFKPFPQTGEIKLSEIKNKATIPIIVHTDKQADFSWPLHSVAGIPDEPPFDKAVRLMRQSREAYDELYRLNRMLKDHLVDHGISRSSVKERVNKMVKIAKQAKYKAKGVV